MTATLTSVVCLLLFYGHAWMLLGHKQKMRSEPTDRPRDQLFSRATQAAAFSAIFAVLIFAMSRRILMAFEFWPPSHWLQFTDVLALPADPVTLVLGTIVFAAGFGLRIWAVRILGRFFTFEIGIRKEHKVIETGPYALIRHPSYTGYLLMLIGTGLAYSSLLLLLLLVAGVFTFFCLRINQEEAMLREHFGTAYEEYMHRTKRLIPFVY